MLLAVAVVAAGPGTHAVPVDTGTGPEVYRHWVELTADLALLATLHPDVARWSSAGKSTLGLDLWVLELTDFARLDGDEVVVLLDGGHHGNEPLGMELVMAEALRLVAGWHDGTTRQLLDDVHVVMVPSVNPDGNLLDTRKNARLVDLNRNYPFHWGAPGCSHNLLSGSYCGPSAGSEPEVQGMIDLFARTEPDIYISMHTGVTRLLHPWGWTRAPSADRALFDEVATAFRAHTGIRAGQAATELYIASGTSQDWAYGTTGTLSWTFEVDPEQYVPFSVEDVETRLAAPLAGVRWFLEHAHGLRQGDIG